MDLGGAVAHGGADSVRSSHLLLHTARQSFPSRSYRLHRGDACGDLGRAVAHSGADSVRSWAAQTLLGGAAKDPFFLMASGPFSLFPPNRHPAPARFVGGGGSFAPVLLQ
jgi:hypothetical protein